ASKCPESHLLRRLLQCLRRRTREDPAGSSPTRGNRTARDIRHGHRRRGVIYRSESMTTKRWTTAGALLLILFLAAGSGRAQDPTRPDRKPSPGADSNSSRRDPKALEDQKTAAAAAALLESAYEGERPPESVRMLAAILRGSRMGSGEGWFGPADNRY